MQLDTIIAPTDLRGDSLPGLQAAGGLARQLGARLVVVHVLTSQAIDTTAPWHEERRPIRDAALGKATSELSVQVAEIGEGLEVETRVVWGDPVDEILRLAVDIQADLIVVTGKHRSRVGKALMGSQLRRLLLEADRPVLTVPRAGA